MSSPRYPRNRRRPVLLPGILGAVASLAGTAAVGGGAWVVIQFVVAILAIIVGVMAIQNRHWWWAPPLFLAAILLNPVLPLDLPQAVWLVILYLSAAVFIAAAVLVRVDDARHGESARPGDRRHDPRRRG